jgi:hypothetical protein
MEETMKKSAYLLKAIIIKGLLGNGILLLLLASISLTVGWQQHVLTQSLIRNQLGITSYPTPFNILLR